MRADGGVALGFEEGDEWGEVGRLVPCTVDYEDGGLWGRHCETEGQNLGSRDVVGAMLVLMFIVM